MGSLTMGIDLGNTNSCVGVFQHGEVDIIKNDQQNNNTPSYVAFTATELLVGDSAKNQKETNFTNTIFNAKKFIGRSWKEVKKYLTSLPFTAVLEKSRHVFKAEFKGETKSFHPEEISAMILIKMKETVEACVGQKVKDAVITVPAYFNNFQRQATKDAAKIAGINVLRLLNESTAAAIAYGMQKNLGLNEDRNVMIVDLGGGSLDVSIVNICKGAYDVKSTSGSVDIGGETFVNRLFDYFAEKFRDKFKKDLKVDKKAVQRLRSACESVKQTLSSKREAQIKLDSLYGGHNFSSGISRYIFEDLCQDIFTAIMNRVKFALNFRRLPKTSIDDIVLVGGATRMPKMLQLLQDFFNGKSVDTSMNPDEAIAYGAAVQAAVIGKERSENIKDISIWDVTSLSLKIKEESGRLYPIVFRNTPLPKTHVQVIPTEFDGQDTVNIGVYEGESRESKKNNKLGQFEFHHMIKAVKGLVKLKISFHLDFDGILLVSASQIYQELITLVNISNTMGHFSQEQLEEMRLDVEKYTKVSSDEVD